MIAREGGSIKAVGPVAANREEFIKIEIYKAWNDCENRFSGLVLSDEVLVEERIPCD